MAYGINPYNLYCDCAGQSSLASQRIYAKALGGSSNHLSRDQVDKRLLKLALDPYTHLSERPFSVFETRDKSAKVGQEVPCVDEHLLVGYLNQPKVRADIHVPEKVKAWDTCAAITYVIKYPKLEGGLSPQMKSLIASKRKLTMLVYNGDVDMVCNFLGDEWFVDDLGRKVVADYQTWKVGKQVGGYVKHYDGITFATVRGSGHMVPGDRPREALQMIKYFLGAKSQNVLL
jgi:cathepsin A (carboxypeptidase C)